MWRIVSAPPWPRRAALFAARTGRLTPARAAGSIRTASSWRRLRPPTGSFHACGDLMNVSYSDPAVAAFVVIPGLLVVALVGGTAVAWKRSGAGLATTAWASTAAGAAAVAWMAGTWMLAKSGVLRE